MLWALKEGRKDVRGRASEGEGLKTYSLHAQERVLSFILSFLRALHYRHSTHPPPFVAFSPFRAIEGCMSRTGVKDRQLPSGMLRASLGKDYQRMFKKTVSSLEDLTRFLCGSRNSRPHVTESFSYHRRCLVPTVHKVTVGADIFSNSTMCPCSLTLIKRDD